MGLLLAYPFPTTIHLYIGILVFVTGWSILSWFRVIFGLLIQRKSIQTMLASVSRSKALALSCSTVLVFLILFRGLHTQPEAIPELPTGQKYFIGATLYNNEGVMSRWSEQLVKLILHRECHITPLQL